MKDSYTGPVLATELAPGLVLPTPVVAAAGTYGFGFDRLFREPIGGLGALITPTLTRLRRRGAAMPRTAESPAGLLHATGLPNPGVESFLAATLGAMAELGYPIIVSISSDDRAGWKELCLLLKAAPGISAIELNLGGGSAPHETTMAGVAKAIRTARRATRLPIIAKLPSSGMEIGAAAMAAVDAGADVIAVSQAFPGVGVRLRTRSFQFPAVVAALSGPCVKPLALYQVWRVSQSVPVPILATGGVMTAEDALEFFAAGATAVGVGVASCIHPGAIQAITAGIGLWLAENGMERAQDLRIAAA